MKRTTTTAIALALAASLAFAASAPAASKTIRQTGQIVGDAATSVKLRVKVKDGQPQKIAGFQATKVLTHCETKKGNVNKRFQYSALNPFPVNADDSFATVLKDDSIGLKITVKGEVNKHGKAVAGTIKTNRFQFRKNEVCKAPKQRFKTAG